MDSRFNVLSSQELSRAFCFFFFFNDTATTEIYTLSLHDALPICRGRRRLHHLPRRDPGRHLAVQGRSEEHTSELQSPCNLVCRLLLEKKKKLINPHTPLLLLTSSLCTLHLALWRYTYPLRLSVTL